MKRGIMSIYSTAKSAIFGLSALGLFSASADAAVVLNMNFNHGVQSPAESPYVAGVGEVVNATYAGSGGLFGSTSFVNTPAPAPAGGGGQAYFNTAQNASNANHAAYHTTNHPEITGSFTAEFLYRPSVVNQVVQQLFYSTTNSLNGISFLDVNANKVRFDLFNGGYTYTSAASLSADQWYHIALVYDESAGQNRLYINGSLDGTQAFGPGPGYVGIDNDHYLLGTPFFGDRNLNGHVDGIALSSGALAPGSFVLEAPIPEPASGGLAATGLAMIAMRRRTQV